MSENDGALAHLEAHRVAAYLDGRLPLAESAVIDGHLAECEACRQEIVDVERIVRPRPARRRAYVIALAATAAAAVLLFAIPRGLRLTDGPLEPSGGQVDSIAMREFGNVAQAPIYLGVAVRAASEQGTKLFAAGMRAYTGARYTNAVTDLRGARSAGVDGPAPSFFLGASHLMLGDAKGAAEEFARVIALRETPYLAEAHYYRAKALLRLGQFDDAVIELERSTRAGNESMQVLAQSLRDSLRLLRAR